jgi:hypothetical protein
MKKHDLFSIPVFEFEVDLKKINIPEMPYRRTWESRVYSTFDVSDKINPPLDTLQYLSNKVLECFDQISGKVDYVKFVRIWRNKYEGTDYQGYHTHPGSNWSFIIYEDVSRSKTQFINPNQSDIWNQNHPTQIFPTDYEPKLRSGNMILFPSWLPHQVLPGNSGTTISGNLICFTDGVNC